MEKFLQKISDDYALGGGTGFDCRSIEELINDYNKGQLRLCSSGRKDYCELKGICEMTLNIICEEKEKERIRLCKFDSVSEQIQFVQKIHLESYPAAQAALKNCREILLNIALAELQSFKNKSNKKIFKKLPLPAQFRRIIKKKEYLDGR